MKTYELVYIISPEMTSEEAGNEAKIIETLVQSKEGIILKQSSPMPKTLSYPIKKRASGFFAVLEFQLEPEKLEEVRTAILKDEKIVRHMITVKEAAKPRKERRAKKTAVIAEGEQKIETEAVKVEEPAAVKTHAAPKEKVELKDIEQKLDELLGE
jgi:small subunit ribosomal protein S6